VCGTSLSALLALWATPLTGSRVSFATARGKDELALTVLLLLMLCDLKYMH
jgi:hypothetical protein